MMQTAIEIQVQAFSVPSQVLCYALPDPAKEPVRYPLNVLDAETLDRLCAEFRAAVFKQAGKLPPPTCKGGE